MYENKTSRFSILAASLLVLLTAGCGSTEPSRFYLLTPMPDDETLERGNDLKLTIGPVSVAEYINRPQIVSRKSPHEIDFSEFHRWAEPLKERVAYVLAENLSLLLATDRVSIFPSKDLGKEDYQITIWIAECDVQPEKEVLFKAWWSLFKSGSHETVLLKSSTFRKPLNDDDDYVACAAAWSEILADFSREIAAAINKE